MKKKLKKLVIKATLVAVVLAFIVSIVFAFTIKGILDIIFSICLGIETIIIAILFIVEVIYEDKK